MKTKRRLTRKEIRGMWNARSAWNASDFLNKKGTSYLRTCFTAIENELKKLDALGVDTDFTDSIRTHLETMEGEYVEY